MNEEKPRPRGWKYKIRPLSEKRKAVELFQKGETPLVEIAKQFGVNPSTITRQWVKQVERGVDRLVGGYKMPNDKLRLKVVREVLSGSITIDQAAEKYGIVDSGTIPRWIKKFNSEIGPEVLPQSMSYSPKERGRKSKTPPSEIQSTEKALEDAKLKILALETMITIAEEQFKIDIRKKYGTKQSE